MRLRLIALVATCAAICSAIENECSSAKLQELVERCPREVQKDVLECVAAIIEPQSTIDVGACFVANRCVTPDTATGLSSLLDDCYEKQSGQIQEDLKRRYLNPRIPVAAAQAPTSTTLSTVTPTPANAQASTKPTCYITTMISTKVCSAVTTGTAKDQTTTECSSTLAPVPTCAPGMICSMDSTGAPLCLRREDNLTMSGLIVTIIFGTLIGATIIGLVIRHFNASRRNSLVTERHDAFPSNSLYRKLDEPSDSRADLPLANPQS